MNQDFWLSSGSAHFWNIGQTKPATDWEREIDDLMRDMTATVDTAERKRLFDGVQRIFAENLPMLYFVAPRLYMGVSARVGGLEPAILRPQLLWNVDQDGGAARAPLTTAWGATSSGVSASRCCSSSWCRRRRCC